MLKEKHNLGGSLLFSGGFALIVRTMFLRHSGVEAPIRKGTRCMTLERANEKNRYTDRRSATMAVHAMSLAPFLVVEVAFDVNSPNVMLINRTEQLNAETPDELSV